MSYRISIYSYLILFVLFLCKVPAFSKQKEVVLLLTGETHATVNPVGNREDSLGGMGRRLTVIKEIRKKYPDLLLLDGGGAFAGGIYDNLSCGDMLDRTRSRIYMKTLAVAGYDAIAVGDEELGFGRAFIDSVSNDSGLLFLSANIPQGKRILPYKIFNRSGLRIAVVGLTTRDNFLSSDINTVVEDPVSSFKGIVGEINNKADYIIVLSHLGEKLSLALADSFPKINLIFNTHRKTSVRPFMKRNKSWVVQFSYLAKELYEFHIFPGKLERKVFKTHLLSKEISSDPRIELYSSELKKINMHRPVLLDLYVMSLCPYGTEAEKTLIPLINDRTSRFQLKIYYIMSKHKNKLSSLHGDAELEENQRQIIIQKYWPEKFFKYIECINKNPYEWKRCFSLSGIDTAAFRKKIGNTGKRLMDYNIERTERLDIHSSPTLYINNRPYEGVLDSIHLLKELCGLLNTENKKIDLCEGIPACIADEDCKMKGEEGKCFEPGTAESRCVFREAKPFDLIVISDSTMPDISNNLEDVINSTLEMLPGTRLKHFDVSHRESEKMLLKYNITKIPALIFSGDVADAQYFGKIRDALKETENVYVLKETIIRNKVLWKRKIVKEQAVVYWSPLDPQANEILGRFLTVAEENGKKLNKVRFVPIVRLDEKGNPYANGGRKELEEISRQIALSREQLLSYLSERQKNWNTSYWEEPLYAINLKPEKIKAISKSRKIKNMLVNIAAEYKEVGEPDNTFFFFLENKFIINARNEADLYKILKIIP